MTKVKICGITNLEDAESAINFGADALGFVFYEKSKRYIEPENAREIISSISDSILKIGVFVNEEIEKLKSIMKLTDLDMSQIHGDESPDYCKLLTQEYIKAFRMKDSSSIGDISRYETDYILLDSFSESEYGGTGKSFNWDLIKQADLSNKYVIISGGLNSGNVKEVIRLAEPYMVDISSGVEKYPGKKDPEKLKEFIEVVKNEC